MSSFPKIGGRGRKAPQTAAPMAPAVKGPMAPAPVAAPAKPVNFGKSMGATSQKPPMQTVKPIKTDRGAFAIKS